MQGLKEKIFDTIKALGNVTLAELERISGFKGNHTWITPPSAKTQYLIWSGMSSKAIEAMQALQTEKKIQGKDCPAITYVMDGRVIVTNNKSVKWIPTLWNVYPE